MKISFVIPAHNEETYLADCLRSILADIERTPSQHAEIIVVNNASTDKTDKIAHGFKDVKVINEPRKGTSYARQAGFIASTGELIANIDADTRLPSGWVKKVLAAFENDKELLALSGLYEFYDLSRFSKFWIFLYYRIAYLISWLKIGPIMQGGNMVIRRSALEKIHGYDVRFTFYGDDADLGRRLQSIGKTEFLLNLPALTSGRRLKREGLLRMGIRYGLNYFSTIFLKRPWTRSGNE